jgi:hypothetical protein
MQALVYAMIIAVLLQEYLSDQFGLPRAFALIPDLLSVIAAAIVIARLPLNRFRDIDPRYMILSGLLIFNLFAGILINQVEPGVVVAGIRQYLKAVPFFFLALVVTFDDRKLIRQFQLIAFLCLVQFPIAWQQRGATIARGGITGDETYGTLMNSAMLSIFLICVACVAIALQVRKKLGFWPMFLFLAATLPSTMINETKATLLLIPVAILAPMFLAGGESGAAAFKRGLVGLGILAVFIAVFIPVYDHFIRQRWGYGLVEFMQREGRVEGYLDQGAKIGSTKEAGRIDSLTIPFSAARGDISLNVFGFGLGNLSHSALGRGFIGEHYERYKNLIGPQVSLLLWEIGVFGLLIVFGFLYRIYKDAFAARSANGLAGALAVGWSGIAMLMVICTVYKNTIMSTAISYLFWFYSGVVAATAMRVRRSSTAYGNGSQPDSSQAVVPRS